MTDIVAGRGGAGNHPLLQLLCAATGAASTTTTGFAPPSGEGTVYSTSGTAASDTAAACSELHGMEQRLAELGPRLGSLAVLLRASVLPAMPWLSVEGADRIQVSQTGQYESVERITVVSLLVGPQS